MDAQSGLRPRRRRNRTPQDEPADQSVVIEAVEPGTCIDLTTDTPTNDVIDLTRFDQGNILMDSPLVILTPVGGGPIRRNRAGSGRRGTRRDSPRRQRLNRRRILNLINHTRRRIGMPSDESDVEDLPDPSVERATASLFAEPLNREDDDDDLPDPLDEPRPSSSSASTSRTQAGLQSPEGVKITCPICMDDFRTIKSEGRQLVSTKCGHIFCATCIKSALASMKKCPTCRKPIFTSSIHPIFL